MNESVGTMNVGESVDEYEWARSGRPLASLPVPAVAPEGFEVRLWEGFGGSIHELADAMEVFGPSEAARVLLSCIGFVEEGLRGRRGTEGLLGRLRLLRGAVVAGGTAVRLEGAGWMMECGNWDRAFWERLGR
jgi:hypothetical protein